MAEGAVDKCLDRDSCNPIDCLRHMVPGRVTIALLRKSLFKLGTSWGLFAAELVPSIFEIRINSGGVSTVLILQKVNHPRWMIVEHSL